MQVIEISIYYLPLTLIHCLLLLPSFRNRMKAWFCWIKYTTTWACWRGSSSACRSESPAQPSPPSQPIRTLPWARCSSAPHFRLSHVDLGDCCLDSDHNRGHLFRFSRFGLVSQFSRLIFVFILSLRDGWSLRNLWRSKLKVSGLLRFVFLKKKKKNHQSDLPIHVKMYPSSLWYKWRDILNWFCTTRASFSWQVWLLPFMWTSESDSSSLIPTLCSTNRRGVCLCCSVFV